MSDSQCTHTYEDVEEAYENGRMAGKMEYAASIGRLTAQIDESQKRLAEAWQPVDMPTNEAHKKEMANHLAAAIVAYYKSGGRGSMALCSRITAQDSTTGTTQETNDEQQTDF